MPSAQVISRRRAAAITRSMELIRERKPDAERLQEISGASYIYSDADKNAAILHELTEMVCRLDVAVDHISEHISASQDKELEFLKKRVDALESGSSKPSTAKPTKKPRKE